jgi:division protein CdvB (Snf7/Vps24/ESCRT-III family)
MKVTFESEDRLEINRLAKSLDMALALFEISHNLFRKIEHNAEIAEEINGILEDYNINLNELIK